MLWELCLAPVAVFCLYLFARDRYEKEPIAFLLVCLFFGAWSAGVVIRLSHRLEVFAPNSILFAAFVTSAGVEEGVKLLLLLLLLWRSPYFNEPFDGALYAAFVSLGFALIENIVYVFHPQIGGITTALRRAVFSVPGHGAFGILMGQQLARARFGQKQLFLAFIVPWLAHSLFNLILLSGLWWRHAAFAVYLFVLWAWVLAALRNLLNCSPFRKKRHGKGDFYYKA